MNRVLVTGSAGFLGSHLVDRLLREGMEVVGVDNLFRGRKQNHLQALRSGGFEFFEADVLDTTEMERVARGCDAVFHLAAINGTKYFYERPRLVMHTNIMGTESVLRAAALHGIGRVVFTSSSEVYGHPSVVPTPEDASTVFEPSTSVRWSYAVSKLIDEHMCVAHARETGTDMAVLRLFNAYGPRQVSSDYGQVVGMFARRLLEGSPPVVFGDGEQTRSFTYVDDMVDGIFRASQHVSGCKVFNIGSSQEMTVNQLALLMTSLVEGTRGMSPEYGEANGDEPRRRCPDIKRAREALGYEPRVTLDDGLTRTLAWFRERRQTASELTANV